MVMKNRLLILVIGLLSMACESKQENKKQGLSDGLTSKRESFEGVPFQSFERAGLGGDSSGGGPGVFCYKDNEVASVQNLDLYEATNLWSKQIEASTAPVTQQLQAAVSRIRSIHPYLASDVEVALRWIGEHHEFVGEDMYFLDPPSDLGSAWRIPLKRNCRVQYVGFYEKEGTLRIATSAYQKMNNTERAAFLLHEAMYALHRERIYYSSKSEISSESTRLMVGCLMAKTCATPEIETRINSFIYEDVNSLEHYLALSNREDFFSLRFSLAENITEPNVFVGANASLSCFLNDTDNYDPDRVYSVPAGGSTTTKENLFELRDIGCRALLVNVAPINTIRTSMEVKHGDRRILVRNDSSARQVWHKFYLYNQAVMNDHELPEFP